MSFVSPVVWEAQFNGKWESYSTFKFAIVRRSGCTSAELYPPHDSFCCSSDSRAMQLVSRPCELVRVDFDLPPVSAVTARNGPACCPVASTNRDSTATTSTHPSPSRSPTVSNARTKTRCDLFSASAGIALRKIGIECWSKRSQHRGLGQFRVALPS